MLTKKNLPIFTQIAQVSLAPALLFLICRPIMRRGFIKTVIYEMLQSLSTLS